MKTASFISKLVASGEYYFLNLTPEKGALGTVVCGGKEACDPHYRVARKRFRYHSVEYVADGAGELAVGDRRYPLKPGAVFYYGPTTPHVIATDSERPLVKFFVDFCGPRFCALLKGHPLAGHAPCYFATASRVHESFVELHQSGRDGGALAAERCACLLELLLLRLAGHALAPGDAESSAQQTYQRCRRLIEDRFLALQTLGDIAASCHADEAYLCRLFRRFGAESPYQLLLRLKMRHAADLLNGEPTLIKQAAKTMGFSDPYHFSRVFKKIYGVSPRAFLLSGHRKVSHDGSAAT